MEKGNFKNKVKSHDSKLTLREVKISNPKKIISSAKNFY